MVIYEKAEKSGINDEANKIPPDFEATPMKTDLQLRNPKLMRGTEYPLVQQIKVLTSLVPLLIMVLMAFLLEQKQMQNTIHLGHVTHHMM